MQRGSIFKWGGKAFGVWAGLCGLVSAAAVEPLERWEKIVESPGETFRSLAAGPGQDGRTYIVATSYQGSILSWPQDAPEEIARVNPNSTAGTVAWGNGRFVVSQELHHSILTSTDALQWEPVEGVSASHVVFGNGVFVGQGASGLLRSTDGISWTEVPVAIRLDRWKHFWTGSKFILPGGDAGVTLQSVDGVEWEEEKTDAFKSVYSIGYGEGRYVAMGIAMGTNVLNSSDAIEWQAVSKLDLLRPMGIAWGNGYFVTVGGSARAYSADGTSWTALPSEATEYTVIFSNGRFIAAGFGTISQSGEVTSLAAHPDGGIEVLGVPKRSYEVQWREDFSEGAEWSTRASFEMPESGVYRWEDGTLSGGSRFYRVLEKGE